MHLKFYQELSPFDYDDAIDLCNKVLGNIVEPRTENQQIFLDGNVQIFVRIQYLICYFAIILFAFFFCFVNNVKNTLWLVIIFEFTITVFLFANHL